ncbi:MAG: ShlB/FhaC/HecB family hemolysin secretion/activation protein [Candidatus Cloacimonetes bacterium]|nr:ShlB/FhaC/HecB family hemolysin secretion/activation protein [Candidatus Cloacimonadota bacterium]
MAQPLAEDAKTARITVKRIVIDGATLIPTDQLHALVADREGQTLSLAELEYLAQRIAEHYRAKGWYVRVYLPQQDVTDGTVHIQIVEGRFGGISLLNQPKRANALVVQNIITHRIQEGAHLSAKDLERGLLIANDLPGIQATGTLQSGSQEGLADLAVQVHDKPIFAADIGANNFGSRSTGRAQLVGGLSLNNLSGIGDQASLRLLAAEHTYSANAGYSLPIGYSGLRLGATLSTLDYKLAKEYSNLNAKGKAHTGGLNASYPLIRQTNHNLYITTGYEHRRYNDDMLGNSLHRHRINAFTFGLNGDMRDQWGQGGVTWGGVQLHSGQMTIKDIANGDKAQDAATTRTHGGYNKLTWNLSRLQNLAPGWAVQANLSGQFADKNLASSEQFSLGGPYQVRAYPGNEGTGSQGALIQLELHKELAPGWQAIAFYDVGTVRQYKNTWRNWNAFGRQPNRYTLQGAGLGVNWRVAGLVVNATVAAPIGDNRGKSASGKNNDGTKSSSIRGWINLTHIF